MIGYTSKHGGNWGIPAGYRHKTIYNYWPNLPLSKPLTNVSIWEEPGFNYTEIPKHGNDLKLHGFFQSLKYFEHCQDEVRHWIRLKETPIDRVGIHIRRGDYVTYADRFPPLGNKYLSESTDYFKSKGYNNFIVFSDDIAWCKNYFKDKSGNFIYSEGRNEYQDLSLLASCEHVIMSSSTFSWIAAWYNTNKNKIIITPSKETWFGQANDLNDKTFDLLPDNWIQMHNNG